MNCALTGVPILDSHAEALLDPEALLMIAIYCPHFGLMNIVVKVPSPQFTVLP